MNNLQEQESKIPEYLKKANLGDHDAHRVLGNIYWNLHRQETAAEHYLQGHLLGNTYCLTNLRRLYESKELPESSDVYKRVKAIIEQAYENVRSENSATTKQAINAGAAAGAVTFLLTLGLIYASDSSGFIKDFSLLIAGVFAFIAVKSVESTFK